MYERLQEIAVPISVVKVPRFRRWCEKHVTIGYSEAQFRAITENDVYEFVPLASERRFLQSNWEVEHVKRLMAY